MAITTANNSAIEVAKFREDFDHKLSEQKLNDVEKQLLHRKYLKLEDELEKLTTKANCKRLTHLLFSSHIRLFC